MKQITPRELLSELEVRAHNAVLGHHEEPRIRGLVLRLRRAGVPDTAIVRAILRGENA